ncbi:histone-like nucleoid-structuring protein Lsr2 [Microbacterium lacticum]
MAKKLITRIIDDLDGTELEDGGRTVSFSLEGRAYEIDLSDKNADKLRDALAPFIKVARSSSASGPRARRSARGSSNLAAVRAWANDNGHTVSERGRVPATVLAAYEAAH